MGNTILTVTGQSASGKSTLVGLLKMTGLFDEAVSTTTRAMRVEDVNGKTYFFVTRPEFVGLVDAGKMVEHIEFDSNLYGISGAEFDRIFAAGKIPAIVVEASGVKQVNAYAKRHGLNTVNVYVDCPDEVLFKRFLERFKNDKNASSTSYAGRLIQMNTTERGWKTDLEYDLVVERFDADTQDDVIKTVINAMTHVPAKDDNDYIVCEHGC